MQAAIIHEIPGRLHILCAGGGLACRQADILEYFLRGIRGVTSAAVYERTGDAVINYDPAVLARSELVAAIGGFSFAASQAGDAVPERTGRMLQHQYLDRMASMLISRGIETLFFPAFLREAAAIVRSVPFVLKACSLLWQGRIEVPVLDAAAVTASLIRRDFKTASQVMFLLRFGDVLEEWTHKKSVDDLMRAMALQVDRVWVRRNGQESLCALEEVEKGDTVIVRMGNLIPLDGKVVEGECAVNQASMTGESLPVLKQPGSYVYSGTVVEEGQMAFVVDKTTGEGRYDRIVRMIETSEKLKSATEDKASHLADSLVPYHLAGTALIYLLTRNTTKALAPLMVDFSCALKLALPIAVLSAMRDLGQQDIVVKGGKAMEAVAEADTIVFDKTGTLTHATPTVAAVYVFDGREEQEMLRLAACLEEHYPHSVASAVVAEARARGLDHEERHSKVEYVVAHGIASTIDGEKVIIGSYHFVFEDEGCQMTPEDEAVIASIPDRFSLLYLALGGRLAAVIAIEDPMREEAAEVVRLLRKAGIDRIVMMTGDSEKTACAIAGQAGVDEYHSEVLPEDKAELIQREQEAGRRVIMVGDGINDTPALSAADAGITISSGAAIAKEIADITITADDLYGLWTLRRTARRLMTRIDATYRTIMTINSGLMIGGIAGLLPPETSALLHNASTIAISLKDRTRLLPPEE